MQTACATSESQQAKRAIGMSSTRCSRPCTRAGPHGPWQHHGFSARHAPCAAAKCAVGHGSPAAARIKLSAKKHTWKHLACFARLAGMESSRAHPTLKTIRRVWHRWVALANMASLTLISPNVTSFIECPR